MKRYCWLLCFFLAFPGCETEDECSVDADCEDSNFCSEDRCRLGRCSYLYIPACCRDDTDCGPSFGFRCEPETNRCVECLEDADCISSEIGPKCHLTSHICVECLSDEDCDPGAKCDPVGNKCTAPRPGQPCVSDTDCDSGWCLTETGSGYPGGSCGIECQRPEDCESFGCVDVFGGRKTCLPICLSDQDCRPEYMCLPTAPDRGSCFPHCTKDADCPVVGECFMWLGICMPDVPLGENGAPCQSEADCKGFCAREADTGAPGGVCVSICSPSKFACPDNDACVWQLSPYLGEANVCLPVFEPMTGCRPEYTPLVAIEFFGDPEPRPVGVCQPACRNDTDCATGTCNLYSGLCNEPVVGADHGAACGTHEECKGHCLFFWPDGYCTGPCHLAAPNCPGDSGCLNLGIQQSCAENCQSDPDCRDGYLCEQTVKQCVPPPQP